MNGWSAHPQGGHPEINFRAGSGFRAVHVMPDHDEPMHENAPGCWCGPVLVSVEPMPRWHHRSSDGTGYTR